MCRVLLLLGVMTCAGLACKSSSRCQSVADCGSGEVCSNGACSTACNVSSECSPGQVCDAGVCTASTGVSCSDHGGCDDGNPCTLDACSVELRLCVSAPAPEGSLCGDDGNACTVLACDGAGMCAASNVSGACDDGDACTEGDSCSDGVCSGGGSVDCDDTNPCTADSCEPGIGCIYAHMSGACDDGNDCTIDVCDAGVCVGSVPGCPQPLGCEIAPVDCADMSCTYDIADEGTPCRSVDGPCDVAETCDGVNRDCPMDVYVGAGAPCRAAPGLCDVVETCTGSGPDCPADDVAGMGTVCNPSEGLCDPQEVCDGSSAICPDDVLTGSGVSCHPSTGECDAEEVCTGSSPLCPTDVNEPDSTVCSIGICISGTCTPPVSVLTDPLGEEVAARFGDTIAIQGDELFVGTPLRGLMANPDFDRGMVHLYRRNINGIWEFDETLMPPVATTEEKFGEHVDVDDDTLVVGADRSGFTTGAYIAVYVRSGDSWALQQTLPNAGDMGIGRTFGNRVALDADTLVSSDNVSTHVYVRSGTVWSLEQTISLEGDRVAISGDTLAFTNTDNTLVQVYARSMGTWSFDTSFGPPSPEVGDSAGWGADIALENDTLIVAAPFRDEGGPTNAGRVYTYRRVAGNWQAPEVLAAPTPVADLEFGNSVGLDGDHLVVGAPGDAGVATGAGAVYVYTEVGGAWQFLDKLLPSPAGEDDRHGASAAVVNGSWVAYAGEEADVAAEANAGRVFVEFVDW